MNNFEIELPGDDQIASFPTNMSLFSYDFSSFSMVPIQNEASKTVTTSIKDILFSNTSNAKIVKEKTKKGDIEYIAKLSDIAKEKINSGEWSLGVKKKNRRNIWCYKRCKNRKDQKFSYIR